MGVKEKPRKAIRLYPGAVVPVQAVSGGGLTGMVAVEVERRDEILEMF